MVPDIAVFRLCFPACNQKPELIRYQNLDTFCLQIFHLYADMCLLPSLVNHWKHVYLADPALCLFLLNLCASDPSKCAFKLISSVGSSVNFDVMTLDFGL